MEVFADALILLLWLMFFVATAMGAYEEFRRGRAKREYMLSNRPAMEDDDPVYLMEPSLQD